MITEIILEGNNKMELFDSHMHTVNSLDGGQTVNELCECAIKKGLKGAAVTDHVDMWFYKSENTYNRIKQCIDQVKAASEKYENRFKLLKGVEMAEYLYSPEEADNIMELTDYDIILGSVHSVFYDDWTDSYSRLAFGAETTDMKKITGFMHEYFARMTEMVENTDIDVMSHLTCPLRYINGKFKRGMDISVFNKEITYILSVIIEREIALEVNTSGINTAFNEFMPGYNIIKNYYDMGGRLITIGSDAHISANIGNGFYEAVKMLRDIGFKSYNYYEKRKPQEVLFDV